MEMRYRWENNILIPDLGASTAVKPHPTSSPSFSSSSTSVPAPNLGSCLLHQKLQMLNCCIERQIKREAAGYGREDTVLHEASSSVFEYPDNDVAAGSVARKLGSAGSSTDDDDDEFFECNDGEEQEGEDDEGDMAEKGEGSASEKTSPKRMSSSKKNLSSEKSMDSSMSETSFKDATLIKPEGRLAPMKNMWSLSTNEPLFIPVTQEPSPMTEDMLEEQAEVLAKLGSTAEGSQLRARMQSACLLSDMESFKAANPGCCLEDFVRWYSPRDFIEEDEEDEDREMGVSRGKMEEGSDKKDDCRASNKKEERESEAVATSNENGSDSPPTEEDFTPSENPESTEATSELNKSETAPGADSLEAAAGPDNSEATSSPSNSGATPEADLSKSTSKPDKMELSSNPDPSTTPCCQRRGHLSQRMQIPGNMWVEVWQSARHVPARRQRRLFDDTKEAEKVLHFLAGIRPSELVLHLLPMLIHASVLKLAEKEDPDVPVLKTLTDQVIAKAVKVSRGPQPPDVKRYEDVVRMIELAETVSSRAKSLKTKFTRDLLEKGKAEEELHNFVSSLLQHPEVDVRGGAYGPAGSAIHKLFSAAQKAALMILEDEENSEEQADKPQVPQTRSASRTHDFPNASAREYILRAMIPRPAPYSRVLPQRMYCVLVEGDYRLAGAFCTDTTFQ